MDFIYGAVIYTHHVNMYIVTFSALGDLVENEVLDGAFYLRGKCEMEQMKRGAHIIR